MRSWSRRLIDQLEWSSKRLTYTFQKLGKDVFPADATSLHTAIPSLGLLKPEEAELLRTLFALRGTCNDTLRQIGAAEYIS